MRSSNTENEEVVKLIEEKLQQASRELINTYQEELHIRNKILEIEKQIGDSLEQEQHHFEEIVHQKREANDIKINDLNGKLQEAMEKGDNLLIQEILNKMSNI